MPAKEIKELRQAGKLEEALNMAKAELEADPDNIWPKRNVSWVYYDYLKLNSSVEHYDLFIASLNEIKNLHLPDEEKILFEQLCWQIGKMAFGLLKTNPTDAQKSIRLFDAVESFHFPKPAEGYSFLFKALHKALKESDRYLEFADWWGFSNFRLEDFQKEKLPNGKEVMSIAEQAFIAYAKHLLPKKTEFGDTVFDKEKVLTFLPVLSEVVEKYQQFQYPAYFQAKLLLALGDKENTLSALIPFAKKKQNDFWVWDVLSEAYKDDPDKVLSCYCKALTCRSPEEMLVNLRQRIAAIFIQKSLYNEARTEIEKLINARQKNDWSIPNQVVNWQSQDWYKNAISKDSNYDFYQSHKDIAESLLFGDIPEEMVIVDFVNSHKKMLNFIASETKFGYFKYERFFGNVKIGDVLKVRFESGSKEGLYKINTAVKIHDDKFKKQFFKEIEGDVRIPEGKQFGFVDDVFINPGIIAKRNLHNGMHVKGTAIKSFNAIKNKLDWKFL